MGPVRRGPLSIPLIYPIQIHQNPLRSLQSSLGVWVHVQDHPHPELETPSQNLVPMCTPYGSKCSLFWVFVWFSKDGSSLVFLEGLFGMFALMPTVLIGD